MLTELEVFIIAGKYITDGYICISNRYRTIGRVDREDWANYLHTSRLKHIKLSTIEQHFKEYYIRCCTADKLTVDEEIYRYVKKHNRLLGLQ